MRIVDIKRSPNEQVFLISTYIADEHMFMNLSAKIKNLIVKIASALRSTKEIDLGL